MILNGRPLNDLSLDDFRTLVDEKTPEELHLDYKQTAYSGRPQDKREMLRDITAFANAGGGYLILGVQEDGVGRAIGFTPIDDPHTIAKAIKQTCLDGISERIDGLEVKAYETGFSQGIIVIRIPSSEQLPHMVTLDGRTDFVRRYDEDKRPMTIYEIRRAILSIPSYRQLLELEFQEKTRQSVSNSGETSGPPYVQAFTERPVEKFIYRYMIGETSTQVLVIVSPYISDLEGTAHDLETIIDKVNTNRTRLLVITRPPSEEYQRASVSLLERCSYAEIRYNSDIHAKLYICWSREERESYALFGSGNLTRGGLYANIELGMMIFSRGHGRRIIRQLYDWSAIGLRASSQLVKSAKFKPGGN